MKENQIKLRTTIDALVADIGSFQLTTQEQYDTGTLLLKKISDTIKQVDAEFEEDRVATKAAYDAVLDEKKVFKKPLEAVDKAIRAKMSEYATAQEKIRQEALRKEKEEAAIRLAEEQAAMGRAQEAERTLARPETVKLTNEPPKVGKLMEVWTAKVHNIEAFLTDIVANGKTDLLQFISVNEIQLAQYLKKAGQKEMSGTTVAVVQRPIL